MQAFASLESLSSIPSARQAVLEWGGVTLAATLLQGLSSAPEAEPIVATLGAWAEDDQLGASVSETALPPMLQYAQLPDVV